MVLRPSGTILSTVLIAPVVSFGATDLAAFFTEFIKALACIANRIILFLASRGGYS
jgi:hypothetical protein